MKHDEQLAKVYDAIDKLETDIQSTRRLVQPLIDEARERNTTSNLIDFLNVYSDLHDMEIQLIQLKKLWIWIK
jgi:glutathionyl-hydroquinone reductase